MISVGNKMVIPKMSEATVWNDIENGSVDSATLTLNYGYIIHDVFFKPDGTMLWLTCSISQYIYNYYFVWPYDLSTAWDISTAVASVPIQLYSAVKGLFFSPDGMYFYLNRSSRIYYHTLSTAWDVHTAAAQGLTGSGDFFWCQPDGLKFYTSRLAQYNLTTAWDFSTATKAYDVIKTNTGIFLNPEKTRLYLITVGTTKYVHQYNFSIPGDLTTMTKQSELQLTTIASSGLFFKPDGSKFYFGQANVLKQYSL